MLSFSIFKFKLVCYKDLMNKSFLKWMLQWERHTLNASLHHDYGCSFSCLCQIVLLIHWFHLLILHCASFKITALNVWLSPCFMIQLIVTWYNWLLIHNYKCKAQSIHYIHNNAVRKKFPCECHLQREVVMHLRKKKEAKTETLIALSVIAWFFVSLEWIASPLSVCEQRKKKQITVTSIWLGLHLLAWCCFCYIHLFQHLSNI